MNFNGKFWHKPGHLGITTTEVKKALQALPTPEAGDAGKVVIVNEAEDGYELGEAGGGGIPDLLVVDTSTFVSSVPLTDIMAHLTAKKPVIVVHQGMIHTYASENSTSMTFQRSRVVKSGETVYFRAFNVKIKDDNSVEYDQIDAEFA